MLKKTFVKVLKDDNCFPNRICDLSIKLDIAKSLPVNEAENLYAETSGNFLVRSVVRALLANHLYFYRVSESDRQSICKRLEIELDEQALNPFNKKFKGLLSAPGERASAEARKAARRRKKSERQRRKQ
jgi:hypothetical protein